MNPKNVVLELSRNSVPILILLISLIISVGGSCGAQADEYLKSPPKCDPPSTLESKYFGTDPKLLLDCRHDQGSTGTCGYHAITSMITALYKNDQKELKSGEGNFSVFDTLEKLGGGAGLQSTTDVPVALLKIQSEVASIAQYQEDVCISDLEIIHPLLSCAGPAPRTLSEQGNILLAELRKLVAERPELRNDAALFSLTRCKRAQNQVKIPPFNIHLYPQLESKMMRDQILGHFRKPGPLPLGVTFCRSPPCANNVHAVSVIGYTEAACVSRLGTRFPIYTAVHLQNSWNKVGDGPFLLNAFLDGIVAGYGSIIAIEPCSGLACKEGFENEADPQAKAFVKYAEVGNLAGLKRTPPSEVNQISQQGRTPLLASINQGNLDAVKILIDKKAAINQASQDGSTPLFIASQLGHPRIVETLLVHKAEVNQTKKDGTTPLMVAAHEGHAEVVSLLLKYGADPDLNVLGHTPLSLAKSKNRGEVVKILENDLLSKKRKLQGQGEEEGKTLESPPLKRRRIVEPEKQKPQD